MKARRITQVRVTPTHARGYSAPFFLIEVDPKSKTKFSDAEKEARLNSRLSDFDAWSFNCVEL